MRRLQLVVAVVAQGERTDPFSLSLALLLLRPSSTLSLALSQAGNRSPLADVDMRGMLIGMQLDKTVGDLALRYYATGEAIALQTRQIIDEMNKSGHKIESIFMSGGCVVVSLFRREREFDIRPLARSLVKNRFLMR